MIEVDEKLVVLVEKKTGLFVNMGLLDHIPSVHPLRYAVRYKDKYQGSFLTGFDKSHKITNAPCADLAIHPSELIIGDELT